MGVLLSLSRVRKARERAAKEARAAANRAAHGRTGAEKKATLTEERRRERALDGARIEGD